MKSTLFIFEKELSNCCNAEIQEGICSECLEQCVSVERQAWLDRVEREIGKISYIQKKNESEYTPLHPERHPTMQDNIKFFQGLENKYKTNILGGIHTDVKNAIGK